MNDFEALSEAITEKMYSNENLALAVALYLEEHNPGAYKEIIDIFDNLIRKKIQNLVEEVLEENKSSEL